MQQPLFIFAITDRVTSSVSNIKQTIVGTRVNLLEEKSTILKDWELIDTLNRSYKSVKNIQESDSLPALNSEGIQNLLITQEVFLKKNLKNLDISFKVPIIQIVGILVPFK